MPTGGNSSAEVPSSNYVKLTAKISHRAAPYLSLPSIPLVMGPPQLPSPRVSCHSYPSTHPSYDHPTVCRLGSALQAID